MSHMFKKVCYLGAVLSLSGSAYASMNYPLPSAISPTQADNIVNSIRANAGAPSGTKISNISYSGSYTLDDGNVLSGIKIDALNFTVKVPILFVTLTDNIHIQASVTILNGDCSNPANVQISETGNNSTIDDQIRGYLNSHSTDLVKNYFIKMTDLVNYCTIKPALDHIINFY